MAVESMEKIVALAKTEALFTPVPKFTAVWQTHGIMALWV